MSAAGPALPPHLLAKRKRQQEEEEHNGDSTASGAKPSKCPDMSEKKRRVVGPAMPPAPIEEKPLEPAKTAEDSDSDDDGGFGPTLPPDNADGDQVEASTNARPEESAAEESKPQRDAWMTMAPQQDDLAARMDPTKQRARGFNTGKGAKAPNPAGEDNSAWYETSEQKQKRLADEMMGISHTPSAHIGPQKPAPKDKSNSGKDDAATAAKVRESRGPSLMDKHKETKGKTVEDDDPSKRTFDREKDMATGMRINHTQREQMLKKAGDFSSKFAGGSYL